MTKPLDIAAVATANDKREFLLNAAGEPIFVRSANQVIGRPWIGDRAPEFRTLRDLYPASSPPSRSKASAWAVVSVMKAWGLL